MRSVTGALVLVVSLAACASAPEQLPHAARAVVELARWHVFDGEQRVGTVRQFEIRDPKQPVRFYRVEDEQGRHVGHATDVLRFSRRVPFREDEEDLGVWSLERGVSRLFDASTNLRLQAVAVDADARRER